MTHLWDKKNADKISVRRGFCCSWLIWNLLLSQSLVLAFKPVGRILSRPCNDWPRGSLNESIFTAIGEDFCHGLRMSFWDFGFPNTAHKYNQAHLALFDCLLIPNRPIFRHRCVIKRQCRPCIYYANSVSTFQPLLVGDLVFKINPGLMYNAGLRIRFVWPIYRPSSHKGLNLRVASVFSRSLASYMFSHAGFIGS